MVTTVSNVPSFFHERFINKILLSKRFNMGELHSDELADLWGFVKYFYRDGKIKRTEFPTKEFKKLCDAVGVEDLHYKISGIGPKAPNQLAIEVSDMSDDPITVDSNGEYNIDIKALKNRVSTVLPMFEVVNREQSIEVVFDDEVYLSDSGVFVGRDILGNEYRLEMNNINSEISMDCRISEYHNNKMTIFIFREEK